MISVCSIGHVTLETPDLSRETDHYAGLVGLTVSGAEKNRSVLSTVSGEEALILEKGADPRLRDISFQVAPGCDLEDIAAHLKAHGIASEFKSDTTPALGKVVEFEDPAGTRVQLFNNVRAAAAGEASPGIAPLKLGHVAFMVPSAKKQVEFYTSLLGFRVSDWMGDYFGFLRCGPDHHTLNFLNGEHSRMHHVAFELKDWAHIQAACDLLGRHDRKIIWGPGRHGIGHNIFIYHRDEDDHIVEFYTEMDQMKSEELGYFEPRPWHKDLPQKPKVWERLDAALTWGPPPTPDFLRSHFRVADEPDFAAAE